MSETVKVSWYCRDYLGDPMEAHEPDECAAEFDTVEDAIEWSEGYCSVYCPSCGAGLTQADAALRILEAS